MFGFLLYVTEYAANYNDNGGVFSIPKVDFSLNFIRLMISAFSVNILTSNLNTKCCRCMTELRCLYLALLNITVDGPHMLVQLKDGPVKDLSFLIRNVSQTLAYSYWYLMSALHSPFYFPLKK